MDYELELLDKPFRANEVEFRIQSTGEVNNKRWAMALCYITNRAIMKRLDLVFGKLNWKNEYKQAPNGGVLCGISVLSNGEWVTKWDGADNTEVEAIKGGLSGSMKRTAVQWGIGRYLYDLENNFVECSEQRVDGWNKGYDAKMKKSFWWKTPKLPSWALPKELVDEEIFSKMLEAVNGGNQKALDRALEYYELSDSQIQELMESFNGVKNG